jgi:heme exporter protein A
MRVTARDLGVRLDGRVVFSEVSFDWRGPGVVAVTGSNGAGKTTLLKVVAGLLAPGRGGVTWSAGDGTSPGGDAPPLAKAAARARLGFVSPELGLYEDLTALENLAFFAAVKGLAWSDADGERWLARVGLAGRGRERLAAYSSGMKQRAKLACALVHAPTLLLLDEPGSNLDAEGRAALAALVHETAARALVVVATNDPAEAAWGATRLTLDPVAAPC